MVVILFQGFDAESVQGGFESVDIQAEVSILDQYIQRLHNACTVRHL